MNTLISEVDFEITLKKKKKEDSNKWNKIKGSSNQLWIRLRYCPKIRSKENRKKKNTKIKIENNFF